MYLTKRYKGSSVIAAIELDMSTVSVRSEIDGGARVAPKSFESGAEETEARDEPAAGDADELAAALDEPALEETQAAQKVAKSAWCMHRYVDGGWAF